MAARARGVKRKPAAIVFEEELVVEEAAEALHPEALLPEAVAAGSEAEHPMVTDVLQTAAAPAVGGPCMGGGAEQPLAATVLQPAAAPAIGGSRAAPEGWEETLRLILEQRKTVVAECDLYGGAVYVAKENTPVTRYQTLVNSILAPQCRDGIVHEAVNNLIGKGCTVEQVLAMGEEAVDACCSKVRMHARKVKAIMAATRLVAEKHAGDIPKTFQELTALPGVGPKSAHFLLMICWDKVEGIKVDTHVHRMCNRLGWVTTSNEEQTRKELQDWLPRDYWGVDGLKKLVGFGQAICTSQNPKCTECSVKARCPSAVLPK